MLVWITGSAGVGKSTVCEVLRERGYPAVDADTDGFNRWVDRSTGEVAVEPPYPVPPGWLSQYAWRVDPERVRWLADNVGDDTVFLAGSVENEVEVWELFDLVICLVADDATLVHRLAARTTNEFGKRPEELAAVLQWNATTEVNYRRFGAEIVDATQSLEAVVELVLQAASAT